MGPGWDIVRKRIACNTFVSHAKHILEKTQTEAYLEFKDKRPEIKMGQRTFEKCKPFYVIAPRSQDRNTCCCRSQVEMRMVFASCMNFLRKTLLTSHDACDNQFSVYKHLTDLVEETLSNLMKAKIITRTVCTDHVMNAARQNSTSCMRNSVWTRMRQKSSGMDLNTWQMMPPTKESSSWQQRKLRLERCSHQLPEVSNPFLHISFVPTGNTSKWKNLLENLPRDHVCCVRDYSENYSCQHQDQLQSLYFSQTQASIHITILHRHAMLSVDGEDSSEDDPVVVTEQLFIISPDCKHNHHSVHEVRSLVATAQSR